jgi:transaldolase
MSAWKDLVQLGMEVWYDDLSRELITSGKLRQMINEDGLSGITSNPTIFENAFKNDPVYIEDINKLKLTRY